ncbi:MAG: TauD/TfdA family dioxygenase [Acidimicrobiaceae bacterium]|nr:TauD/TfdA family dioxygenase [Acidimicrobiaceae bacterium]
MSAEPDATATAGHGEQRLADVQVRPLSVNIGAEIGGVDLSCPLTPAEVADIWAALLRWKVVFFRGQELDHRAHVAMARQFGVPTPGHVVFGGNEEHPEIYSIAKYRTANSTNAPPLMRPWTGWHTDITAAINPPGQSILRSDTVPPYGGDTQWVNLAAAYEALSPALRGFVDGLRGVHRYAVPIGDQSSTELERSIREQSLVSEHPLVRVHPETGERVLYVSPAFLEAIVDLAPRESQVLLEMLWEHSVRPEFTVRFRWEPGCVAFWDNRSTAHLAPRDIFETDFDRQFWRVTLMGEVPVGVDGRSSTSIEGRPIAPA